jgi:hypothetical protein
MTAPFQRATHPWDTSSPHAWAEDARAYSFDAEQRPYQLPRPFSQATSALGALVRKMSLRSQCSMHRAHSVGAGNDSLVRLCWAALVWSPIGAQVDTAHFLILVHRLIVDPCARADCGPLSPRAAGVLTNILKQGCICHGIQCLL